MHERFLQLEKSTARTRYTGRRATGLSNVCIERCWTSISASSVAPSGKKPWMRCSKAWMTTSSSTKPNSPCISRGGVPCFGQSPALLRRCFYRDLVPDPRERDRFENIQCALIHHPELGLLAA